MKQILELGLPDEKDRGWEQKPEYLNELKLINEQLRRLKKDDIKLKIQEYGIAKWRSDMKEKNTLVIHRNSKKV